MRRDCYWKTPNKPTVGSARHHWIAFLVPECSWVLPRRNESRLELTMRWYQADAAAIAWMSEQSGPKSSLRFIPQSTKTINWEEKLCKINQRHRRCIARKKTLHRNSTMAHVETSGRNTASIFLISSFWSAARRSSDSGRLKMYCIEPHCHSKYPAHASLGGDL